jgi:DNA (cytosine-5)-methyltransferase 1
MSAYYNDNDRHCAQWLRNLIAAGLIPQGDVDERSIADVCADDLRGYTQCHFFAGIGGWAYALQLAGWPDDSPVWTGSCPCQPFSVAGKLEGTGDPRHLWPEWFRLIRECSPPIAFGEQVASKAAYQWLDDVLHDMESIGYACGAASIPACSVNAPHMRQRIYWIADATIYRCERHIGSVATQVPSDGAPQTLDPWHTTGSPFEHWHKLLAQPNVCRVVDGISSLVDIRPRLHAYGNTIVPQVAAQFVSACMEDAHARRDD